ncbi:putative D-hydroxyacid dehydrogenase [Pseudovirgaria hyperparasitica]|uniref:Putative D-hydroxyacid dehydrogenase n=1 Tax=Pseudovirgaria hyperparasitica TaxID=470096 RepID=A0A6A6W728_9PEZI|nr:putative D-hydroxyacid dehydrogenase [Pseudovirgaria hyperparasitica]KAF2757770.1 putative D-hydroxyacid dehydrogenase [Pseudovirgaria hyperparasitica]
MKLAVFSTQPYDQQFFEQCRAAKAPQTLEIAYHSFPLSAETVALASGCESICVFVNDNLTEPVLEKLKMLGVRAILLRCAGFNNVDLKAAERLGFFVANVPSYSPEAVAEFAVTLVQTINRNTHRAYNRVREGNFALDGLLGRTLHGKTVGVIGTGKIGIAFARIMKGYGCRIVAYDVYRNPDFDSLGQYKTLEEVLPLSDIVSLHCPLIDSTRHLINSRALAQMKPGALLVNTSRGGLIDTTAVIQALKSKRLRGLALDVYEAEAALFYSDHSSDIIQDDVFQRLMTFPNVIVCGHQGFFTEEALAEIAEVTFTNLEDYRHGRIGRNNIIGRN